MSRLADGWNGAGQAMDDDELANLSFETPVFTGAATSAALQREMLSSAPATARVVPKAPSQVSAQAWEFPMPTALPISAASAFAPPPRPPPAPSTSTGPAAPWRCDRPLQPRPHYRPPPPPGYRPAATQCRPPPPLYHPTPAAAAGAPACPERAPPVSPPPAPVPGGTAASSPRPQYRPALAGAAQPRAAPRCPPMPLPGVPLYGRVPPPPQAVHQQVPVPLMHNAPHFPAQGRQAAGDVVPAAALQRALRCGIGPPQPPATCGNNKNACAPGSPGGSITASATGSDADESRGGSRSSARGSTSGSVSACTGDSSTGVTADASINVGEGSRSGDVGEGSSGGGVGEGSSGGGIVGEGSSGGDVVGASSSTQGSGGAVGASSSGVCIGWEEEVAPSRRMCVGWEEEVTASGGGSGAGLGGAVASDGGKGKGKAVVGYAASSSGISTQSAARASAGSSGISTQSAARASAGSSGISTATTAGGSGSSSGGINGGVVGSSSGNGGSGQASGGALPGPWKGRLADSPLEEVRLRQRLMQLKDSHESAAEHEQRPLMLRLAEMEATALAGRRGQGHLQAQQQQPPTAFPTTLKEPLSLRCSSLMLGNLAVAYGSASSGGNSGSGSSSGALPHLKPSLSPRGSSLCLQQFTCRWQVHRDGQGRRALVWLQLRADRVRVEVTVGATDWRLEIMYHDLLVPGFLEEGVAAAGGGGGGGSSQQVTHEVAQQQGQWQQAKPPPSTQQGQQQKRPTVLYLRLRSLPRVFRRDTGGSGGGNGANGGIGNGGGGGRQPIAHRGRGRGRGGRLGFGAAFGNGAGGRGRGRGLLPRRAGDASSRGVAGGPSTSRGSTSGGSSRLQRQQQVLQRGRSGSGGSGEWQQQMEQLARQLEGGEIDPETYQAMCDALGPPPVADHPTWDGWADPEDDDEDGGDDVRSISPSAGGGPGGGRAGSKAEAGNSSGGGFKQIGREWQQHQRGGVGWYERVAGRWPLGEGVDFGSCFCYRFELMPDGPQVKAIPGSIPAGSSLQQHKHQGGSTRLAEWLVQSLGVVDRVPSHKACMAVVHPPRPPPKQVGGIDSEDDEDSDEDEEQGQLRRKRKQRAARKAAETVQPEFPILYRCMACRPTEPLQQQGLGPLSASQQQQQQPELCRECFAIHWFLHACVSGGVITLDQASDPALRSAVSAVAAGGGDQGMGGGGTGGSSGGGGRRGGGGGGGGSGGGGGGGPLRAVHALMMMYAAERRGVHDAVSCFRSHAAVPVMTDRLRKLVSDEWVGSGNQVATVYRLHITPTRLCPQTPEEETSNSVLRTWAPRVGGDRFLRVTFTEEDGSALDAGRGDANEAVFDRMRSILVKRGVCVADRHYRYLGNSSSQLRMQSAWFFADVRRGGPGQERVTAEMVRTGFGQLMSIRPPAKCSARIGQWFSTTIDTGDELNEWEVVEIRDEYTADGCYCFSDGVGKLSPGLARDASEALVRAGRWQEGAPPASAFQIRYGGAKGMVVVDHTIGGKRLCVRPSMRKFESTKRLLAVCTPSVYKNAFLNRQIITVLDSLNVNSEYILFLQSETLKSIERLAGSNADALDVLTRFGGGDRGAWMQLREALAASDNHGGPLWDAQEEPWLRSMLGAMRAQYMLDLRCRARIIVGQAAMLHGVLDEWGVLKNGEVFLQVQEDRCVEPHVIEHPVLVTRHPCMHPGDVRYLMARDVPLTWQPGQGSRGGAGPSSSRQSPPAEIPSPLRQLVNVIVFPKDGYRPLPHMMGRGDLDGDEFWVCWDKGLIPGIVNHPPATYGAAGSGSGSGGGGAGSGGGGGSGGSQPRGTPASSSVAAAAESPSEARGNIEALKSSQLGLAKRGEHTTLEELCCHLVDYGRQVTLGRLCNAHLARADQEEEGARSQPCLQLAELAARAVDFAKTGVRVEVPQNLMPDRWPDFMEKPGKASYRSNKILGTLYRTVQCTACPQPARLPASAATAAAECERMSPPAWERYLKAALQHKVQYLSTMVTLMSHYDVASESQLVAGCPAWDSSRARGGGGGGPSGSAWDRYDRRDSLISAVQRLQQRMRQAFDDVFAEDANGQQDRKNLELKRMQLACAWYQVTYNDAYRCTPAGRRMAGHDTPRMYSLPWIQADELTKYRRDKAVYDWEMAQAFAKGEL